jgi:hypothetical protein
MKQMFKKISFQPGDLIIDIKDIKSGIVIELLIRHVKVIWEGKEVKISKWLLNNKILNQEYKYHPRSKNNNTKKK